jgi:hypothetical protein
MMVVVGGSVGAGEEPLRWQEMFVTVAMDTLVGG